MRVCVCVCVRDCTRVYVRGCLRVCLLLYLTALPDYKGYSPAELAQLLYEGVYVFRGRDWKWNAQDGMRSGMVSTNMSTHNNVGWVRVNFPAAVGNKENSYRMGAESAYDLFRNCGKFGTELWSSLT